MDALRTKPQVDDVGEVQGTLGADHIGGDKTSRLDDHHEALEVRFVDEIEHALVQFGERRFSTSDPPIVFGWRFPWK